MNETLSILTATGTETEMRRYMMEIIAQMILLMKSILPGSRIRIHKAGAAVIMEQKKGPLPEERDAAGLPQKPERQEAGTEPGLESGLCAVRCWQQYSAWWPEVFSGELQESAASLHRRQKYSSPQADS